MGKQPQPRGEGRGEMGSDVFFSREAHHWVLMGQSIPAISFVRAETSVCLLKKSGAGSMAPVSML